MIYDPFQKKAIDYIKEGHSCLVSAPTGAGKTVIAEYVINDSLARGTKVIYTAPIKALSNQKYRDFQGIFKDKIGILTGDVSINPHAQVLIMTTEIFRNKLLEKHSGLEKYSWIIFDEIHYLDDYQRGTVWEESLIFLPQHMKMLALSATIPNIDELSQWIHSVHKKPIKVVREEKRPVPLHFFYQYHGMILDNFKKLRSFARHKSPNRPVTLINRLYRENKLPCIYFVFGRRRCEYLAEELVGSDFLNEKERRDIIALYEKLCHRFDLIGEKSASIMRSLIERGIAYHHAGMLPTLKEVIEQLFTSRLVKVIFTTETFALGINMPARTVVFDELRKYSGRFFGTLKTRDFYQMAGRAGRRGIDTEGFVYSRINPHYTTLEEVWRVIYGRPEKVISRFNASYATILNLYQKFGEGLYDIYPLSFHYFQKNTRKRDKAIKLLQAKVKLLKELKHIGPDGLTDKGIFASRVYGYEMPIAELYDEGLLEDLTAVQLGVVSLAMVFEPRKGARKPILSKNTKHLWRITDNMLYRINKIEKRLEIAPFSKRCFYHLTSCLEAWMNKEPFDRILRHTDADEGEVIRCFRMTIQVLREVLNAPVSSGLKEKVHKSISLINRGIIDAEKQLRE